MLSAFCGFVYQRVTNLLGTQTARLCSIFGTDISQARNDFVRDNFPCRILSNARAEAYGEHNSVGTPDA